MFPFMLTIINHLYSSLHDIKANDIKANDIQATASRVTIGLCSPG